jgi:hypothetical protein
MNGTGPPGNANAGLANRRRGKLITLREYHALDSVQANTIWSGWCRHALWIFSRYWRSANPKDLLAFARHVHGMRMHDGRRIARVADEIERSAQ